MFCTFRKLSEKKIRVSLEVSRRSCHNCSSCVLKHILEGITFLRRNSLFSVFFLTLSKKIVVFWQKFFNWVEKIAFLSLSQSFCENSWNQSSDFPINFAPDQDFFGFPTKTFLHDGQNFILRGHRHIMRKKLFKNFLFFSIFFGHRAKLLAFWKFFGRVVKTAV